MILIREILHSKSRVKFVGFSHLRVVKFVVRKLNLLKRCISVGRACALYSIGVGFERRLGILVVLRHAFRDICHFLRRFLEEYPKPGNHHLLPVAYKLLCVTQTINVCNMSYSTDNVARYTDVLNP